MKDHILIGTVRAKKGDKYVVVTRDGSPMEVKFDGGAHPPVGGDVIGVFRASPYGGWLLSLKENLNDAMMSTSTSFMIAGARPDLTARILAKMLAKQKTAVIAPGAGMIIKRRPFSVDPDLQWALDAVAPEADRLGTALNFIDVKSITNSVWQTSSLRDMALPADIEGSQRSMFELTRILRSGFHPECSRMIETVSGARDISVNFVMPYSPFTGVLGFARNIAAMNYGYLPIVDMTLSDSRKLSSVRMAGLAVAHKVLGAGQVSNADVEQSPRARHLANCFADALTSVVYLSRENNPAVIHAYADLRESSLCFGFDQGRYQLSEGILEDATHRAIRAVLKDFAGGKISSSMTSHEMTDMALKIARKTALPAARFENDGVKVERAEMTSAVEAANRVAFDLRQATPADIEAYAGYYVDDIQQLVEEHGGNALSASRLVTFGGNHVPFGMEDYFHAETYDLATQFDDSSLNVETNGKKDISVALLDRIKLSKSSQPVSRLQYAEPKPIGF